MHFYTLVGAFLASTALAAPSANNNNNINVFTRGEKTVMEISYCNSCTPSTGGPAGCGQTQYQHTKKEGEGGHGDCHTPPTPFNDACSADRTIHTPFGDGDFKPVPGCDTNADNGTVQGHISGLADGGGKFRFTCYKAYEQFHVFCGVDYACNVYLRCVQG